MQKTIAGTYRDGRIHLLEQPEGISESKVLVTFLESGDAPMPLTRDEAAETRGKLAAWEEDWNAPGMEIYDEP